MEWQKRGRGRPRVCTHIIKRILELHKEKWTYRAIAIHLGISSMTVWRYCNERKYVD